MEKRPAARTTKSNLPLSTEKGVRACARTLAW
jgi:hypothetical protein